MKLGSVTRKGYNGYSHPQLTVTTPNLFFAEELSCLPPNIMPLRKIVCMKRFRIFFFIALKCNLEVLPTNIVTIIGAQIIFKNYVKSSQNVWLDKNS